MSTLFIILLKTMKLTIQRTLDEDEEIPKYLMKEKPHHNWHVVQALANRQIGNSSLFQRRFYGSLSAVERLNRMCNLNQHQVNYFLRFCTKCTFCMFPEVGYHATLYISSLTIFNY